jgi:hypothetical protein
MELAQVEATQVDATSPRRPAELIDIAVIKINGIQRKKALENAVDIGRCVLDLLFEESWRAFQAKSRSDRSYRELAGHDALEISSTKLWYSVAVIEHLETWPDDIFWSLSFTHHKHLIPVKDKAARLTLAKQAVKHGWSVSRLQSEITQHRSLHEEPSNAGRPPKSPLSKIVDRISRDVEQLLEQTDENAIDEQSIKDIRFAMTTVGLSVNGMQQSLKQLRKRVEELERGRY